MANFFFSIRGLAWLAIVATALPGCSREWYREQADGEAADLISEKNTPRWDVPYHGIDMDPRSRYFDAWDRVRPPMPADDPESHQLMHYIDGKEGWDQWHDNGDIIDLENPDWRARLAEYTQLTEDGKILLTLDDAVKIAMIHSPSYQRNLETLYLSALDVSTERFRFDAQFFGGAGSGSMNNTNIGVNGSELRGLGSNSSAGDSFNLSNRTNIDIRRRFATAGELIVGFANSLVWQFSGSDVNFASSIINFSFVQPLLRAAGRNIALETLTIAERTLLANIRSFASYQQSFYSNIAVGVDAGVRPSRRGGFFGGTGLSGFTGQGSGGFGGVGDATGFGGSGGFGGGGGDGSSAGSGFAGGGAGQIGGFLGLLQSLQQIRNTEASLAAQLQTLQLLEAHLEAGLIDIAQVDQFRQSIETERANLLQSKNGFQNGLEGFKVGRLGLPPDLPMELDDKLIEPFQFIDPRTQNLQKELDVIVDAFGQLGDEPSVDQTRKALTDIQSLSTKVQDQFSVIEKDFESFQKILPGRMKDFDVPAERRLFEKDVKQLTENLDAAKKSFARLFKEIKDMLSTLTVQNRKDIGIRMVATNVELTNLLAELTLIQARIRTETITLDPVRLDSQTALEIARANRIDWMNNRASLVNTWRLVEFNANRLESSVDVFINGQMGTVDDNGAKFRAENSAINAGIRFDAPLTRLLERNSFRQQLIIYQQSRRGMIQYEDGVNSTLRALLRNLEQLEVNLEIQRRAVAIAIRRADQTRENLNRPAPPAAPGVAAPQFGPTAALNLLTALSDLRSTQNAFMSVWLAYHASRIRLMLELGIFRVDENGIWIEESIDDALRASAADMPLPPALHGDVIDALEQYNRANPSEGDAKQSVDSGDQRTEANDSPLPRAIPDTLPNNAKPNTQPQRLPPALPPQPGTNKAGIPNAPPAELNLDNNSAQLHRLPGSPNSVSPESASGKTITLDRRDLEPPTKLVRNQAGMKRAQRRSPIEAPASRLRGPLPRTARPESSRKMAPFEKLTKPVPLIQLPTVPPADDQGLDAASFERPARKTVVPPTKRRTNSSRQKGWRATSQ